MASLVQTVRKNVLSPLKYNLVKPVAETMFRAVREQVVQHAYRDPAVVYPCYKSFDDLIDLKRLQSLDAYMIERIQEHKKKQQDERFHAGILTLKANSPAKTGSRIIYLSQNKAPGGGYFDLSNPELWTISETAGEFSLLMDFIATLPFKSRARMIIMYDDSGQVVTPHRDHSQLEICHEFIWFRTNMAKPFYMLNPKTKEKRYVESYSAWFDSVNQFHGADAHPGMSFSIRVDGIFSDEFRKLIPVPKRNAASIPALWACTSPSQATSR